MKAALARQPLSVSIEADRSVFQNYRSGIFNSTACGTSLDHATNVVGWGTSGGVDYWLMRNSWGTTWGESGYMRV
jgi:C1A family cysteine protease